MNKLKYIFLKIVSGNASVIRAAATDGDTKTVRIMLEVGVTPKACEDAMDAACLYGHLGIALTLADSLVNFDRKGVEEWLSGTRPSVIPR